MNVESHLILICGMPGMYIWTKSIPASYFSFFSVIHPNVMKSGRIHVKSMVDSMRKHLIRIRDLKHTQIHCIDKPYGVRVQLWYKQPDVEIYTDCLDFDIEVQDCRTQTEFMHKRIRQTVHYWSCTCRIVPRVNYFNYFCTPLQCILSVCILSACLEHFAFCFQACQQTKVMP